MATAAWNGTKWHNISERGSHTTFYIAFAKSYCLLQLNADVHFMFCICRNYNEVKLHAHKYFLKLQAKKASNNHTNGTVLQQRTARWTMEEDIIFEGSLAACLRGSSKASPLERGKDFAIEISKALPGKTALEIKERQVVLIQHDTKRV